VAGVLLANWVSCGADKLPVIAERGRGKWERGRVGEFLLLLIFTEQSTKES
jgi:hypothetical protein